MERSARAGTRVAHLLRDAAGRVDLKSMSRAEVERFVAGRCGVAPERGRAVYQQVWQRGARDFMDMEGVARSTRERLAEVAYLPSLELELHLRSRDGTEKFLWRLEDGCTIESVLIPDGDRRLTLCMSSQVGCAMACTFCLTGDLGLTRHLKPSEIANQALQVQQRLGERRITNLVLMGMGEPLHNLDNLVTALSTCLDDRGLKFSHRRVTVSTVGLVPKMAELARALPVNLAVSLNATTEDQRRRIMPITRRHSLAELVEACRNFPLPPGKRITFEYVMIAGFNDTLDDARRLQALLEGIPAKINLIPYNENPDRDLRRPSDAAVKAFQHFFVRQGIACHVRTTKGLDISAACGQLGRAREQAVRIAEATS